MKIYTRKGDTGQTAIRGGQRVEKDDIRIEANGCLDELNSVIGLVRAYLSAEHEWQPLLFRIQSELMLVMSQVATPSENRKNNPRKPSEKLAEFCEEQMDILTNQIGERHGFILPGGNLVAAHLHLARTIARRSERRLCTLNREDPLPEMLLPFINRLSDLFFIMARYELYQQGIKEEKS